MSAIEIRTMSPATTSQIATCCVVLNVMTPIQARTCAMAAKSRTKIETNFVMLRVDAEKASPSAVSPENIDRSQVLFMVPPT
jgi:hypothetical protein